MRSLVWVHDQIILDGGNCLYVYYDKEKDEVNIVEERFPYAYIPILATEELDTFYSKLLLSCNFIFTFNKVDYYGVEIYVFNGVRTYLAHDNANCHIIVEVNVPVYNVQSISKSYFKADLYCDEGSRKFFVINCNKSVLMLMSKSESFRYTILNRICYVGVCGACNCTMSAINGITYTML